MCNTRTNPLDNCRCYTASCFSAGNFCTPVLDTSLTHNVMFYKCTWKVSMKILQPVHFLICNAGFKWFISQEKWLMHCKIVCISNSLYFRCCYVTGIYETAVCLSSHAVPISFSLVIVSPPPPLINFFLCVLV